MGLPCFAFAGADASQCDIAEAAGVLDWFRGLDYDVPERKRKVGKLHRSTVSTPQTTRKPLGPERMVRPFRLMTSGPALMDLGIYK